MTTDSELEWNVSKDYGTELVRLISIVNDAALKGNFKEWYNALGVLFNNASIHKKMDKEAMKKLLEEYLNLSNEIYTKENISVKSTGYQYVQEKNIKTKLFTLHRTLLEHMHNADLMLPINMENIKSIYKR